MTDGVKRSLTRRRQLVVTMRHHQQQQHSEYKNPCELPSHRASDGSARWYPTWLTPHYLIAPDRYLAERPT